MYTGYIQGQESIELCQGRGYIELSVDENRVMRDRLIDFIIVLDCIILIQQIECTVVLSLTALFSFLSESKYGATLTKAGVSSPAPGELLYFPCLLNQTLQIQTIRSIAETSVVKRPGTLVPSRY